MYDFEQIGKIIADLEKYFKDLDQYKVESSSMGTDRFYIISMILFAIFNRIIDLGKEIIRGRKLGMPTSYKQIFQILEREKIISPELSGELQYLADRRNVLAHEYHDITKQSIYVLYVKIKSAKEFMEIVKEVIASKKNNRKNNGRKLSTTKK